MPLKSHLTLNAAVFNPANVAEETKAVNAAILAGAEGQPKWTEVGAPRYREMRWRGETALPAPEILPDGINTSIPSRGSHSIPIRYFLPPSKPDGTASTPKGIFMHIHGGGWVLFDEKSSDRLLSFYAQTTGCVVVSVGYRLAPEDPWPRGVEDVEDAGSWLVDNGAGKGWGELRYIGGESAGGHLSLLAAYHLLRSNPTFRLPGGLILHFPATDLSSLPSSHTNPSAPILSRLDIQNFISAFLPNTSGSELKNPRISPLYEDLQGFRDRLPRMLCTCGTNDALLDDSVLMVAKWQMAGGEAVLRCYEGAPHGFIAFPMEMLGVAGKGLADVVEWVGDGVEAEESAKGKGEKERL